MGGNRCITDPAHHRFPASGFPYHTKDLSLLHTKVNPSDRLHFSLWRVKTDRQILQLQNFLCQCLHLKPWFYFCSVHSSIFHMTPTAWCPSTRDVSNPDKALVPT